MLGCCQFTISAFLTPLSLSLLLSAHLSCRIVPFVNPRATGSIAGIVGAGGNTGAVCFGLAFRQLADDKDAFVAMGCAILASSLLTGLIFIKGHSSLFCGQQENGVNVPTSVDKIAVPGQSVEISKAIEAEDEKGAADKEVPEQPEVEKPKTDTEA